MIPIPDRGAKCAIGRMPLPICHSQIFERRSTARNLFKDLKTGVFRRLARFEKQRNNSQITAAEQRKISGLPATNSGNISGKNTTFSKAEKIKEGSPRAPAA